MAEFDMDAFMSGNDHPDDERKQEKSQGDSFDMDAFMSGATDDDATATPKSPAPIWEDGDGGAATMPEGETNQWGGNLRNEGRKPFIRRDASGKISGYSTTSSMAVRHDDGRIAIIPTIVDGQELSQDDAVKHYAETGEHWGMADNEDDARKIAKAVHDEHQNSYQKGWNDYIHGHWDEVSDEIRNDAGMRSEHSRRRREERVKADGVDKAAEMAGEEVTPVTRPLGFGMPAQVKRKKPETVQVAPDLFLTGDVLDDSEGRTVKPGQFVTLSRKDGTSRLLSFEGRSKDGKPVFKEVKNVSGAGADLAGEINISEDDYNSMFANDNAKKDRSPLEQVRLQALADTGDARRYTDSAHGTFNALYDYLMPFFGGSAKKANNERTRHLSNIYEGNLDGYDGETDAEKYRDAARKAKIEPLNPLESLHPGESDEDFLERIRKEAGDELRLGAAAKQKAAAELGNTEATVGDKIIKGGITSGGFALQFAIPGSILFKGLSATAMGAKAVQALTMLGSAVPATIAEADARYSENITPEYGWKMKSLDGEPEFGMTAAPDEQAEAAYKAIGGAVFDSAVEVGLEAATMGLLRLAGRPSGWVLGKVTPNAVKEWGAKKFNKFMASDIGQALRSINRAYQDFSHMTQINSPLGELAEENVQALEKAINLDGKTSEYKGFSKEWHDFKDKQLNWQTQWDIFYGLIAQLAIGSAKSTAEGVVRHVSEADARRDVRMALKRSDISDETISTLTPKQQKTLDHMWRHYSANPDELRAKVKNLGISMRLAADELLSRESSKMAAELRRQGVEPVKFTIQTGEDGKLAFQRMTRITPDGKKAPMNAMVDAEHGVTIVDQGDGTFYVMNDLRGLDAIPANSFEEAQKKADKEALTNQTKNRWNKVAAQRLMELTDPENGPYRGRKIVSIPSETALRWQVAQAIQDGKPLMGITRADQLFKEDGSLKQPGAGGFHTPDGHIVVILDNVPSPAEMERVLAHEATGHEGVESATGRGANTVEFIQNAQAEGFSRFVEGERQRRIAANMAAGMDEESAVAEAEAHMATDDYKRESMARYAQGRLHQPTWYERKKHEANQRRRDAGENVPIDQSDLEVMLAEAEKQGAQGANDLETLSGDSGVRYEEGATDEAGNGTDEAQPQQADEDAGRNGQQPAEEAGARPEAQDAPGGEAADSGVVEPRRLTSAEEVIATAKTPFSEVEKKALEDAADVSAIDATDETPPQTDFLSILSKDAPVVRLNPAKVDRSDAVLPNMKKDANRNSGITKPLSGEWHPTMGGIGAVWLTKDGKLVVITGRHRSELAERKGKSMLYYLYREADGFTKEDALIYDAVANIHDEKGTINDYLGFLDRINPTREQAEKAGILSGKGLVAWSLYKDATEAVRSATAMDGNPGEGQISPQQATVIAEAAPRDADKRNPSIQRQLLKTALGGMRGKAFDMYARIRAEELSKAPLNENLLAGEQMDLFSSPEDQAADILAQRQSQYRTKKAQGYQTVAQNLRAALNKEGKLELTDEYAKDLGVTDKSDKKQLEAAYEKAVERANYWENTVRLDDADKTAMDAEINAAADARAKKLAELKAKREAAKSGKPAPKPKTETPAAVQKPDISTFVKAQREVEADDDFEGDRGLADLIESLPPESAQKLISLWNESDRLDSEADKLVDEHGRLTRFNQTKFDSDENERKYGDLRARARDLQNEAHNMLLREAEANGWEQGDDAETGNVRWVKKPAQKSAPSTDDAKMARAKAAAEKHVVSYGNGMKGTLADMIKNGAATLYPAKGLTIFDKGAHVVTIGFEQFKPTNDELPYLAKLQQERDAAEPAKTAPVSEPPKTEATTPPKAEKPVEGRKSSDTAKPAPKRQPSIKMKDEAAEKLAQKQEDDLAALFDTPELGVNSRMAALGVPYQGSKSRIARRLVAVLPSGRRFVDLFSGGGAVTHAAMESGKFGTYRMNDLDGVGQRLFLQGARGEWDGYDRASMTPEEFAALKGTPEALAWSFNGLGRNLAKPEEGGRDKAAEQIRRVKSLSSLKGQMGKVVASENDYRNVKLYKGDVVYADIPYENTDTRGYRKGMQFDKAAFVEWAQRQSVPVFVSEYAMPDSWTEIASFGVPGMRGGDRVEKLFVQDKFAEQVRNAPGVSFDTKTFDPDVFQKRVGAVAKLVKTYKDSGVADFKTLATRMAERFPEKFDAMKPYLRGVWNAVADQMDLADVSRGEAEKVYGIIEAQAKEVEDEQLRESGTANDRNDTGVQGVRPRDAGGSRPQGGFGDVDPSTGESGAAEPVRDVQRDGVPEEGRVSGELLERHEVRDGVPELHEGGDGGGQAAGAEDKSRGSGGRSAPGGESGVRVEPGQSGELDGGEQGRVEASSPEEAAHKASPETPSNYVITKEDEDWLENSKPSEKVKNNIDVLNLLNTLAEEDRAPTPEEKTKLARYVGFGGFPQMFDEAYERTFEKYGDKSAADLPVQTQAALRKTRFGLKGYDYYREIRNLLSQGEIDSMKQAMIDAFFTPINMCRLAHKAFKAAGFNGGRMLETSAGTGNFIGTAEYDNPATWTAIEKDKTTGKILQHLYPLANVKIQGFEETPIPPNFMDAIISNVPFGTTKLHDPEYNKHGFSIHDYFIARSIDRLHVGGVAAFLTSHYTLDKADKALVRYLEEHGGKIVGSVRLPNGHQEKNAGTAVSADIIFIQKVPGRADNSQYAKNGKAAGMPINAYYENNPDMVFGTPRKGRSMYGEGEELKIDATRDMSELDGVVMKAAEGLKYVPSEQAQSEDPITLDADKYGIRKGNITIKDGKVYRREGDMLIPVREEIEKIRWTKKLSSKGYTVMGAIEDMIKLRDAYHAYIDAQKNGTEDDVKRKRAILNTQYDVMQARYGSFNGTPVMAKIFNLDDADGVALQQLEAFDEVIVGQTETGKPKKEKRNFRKSDTLRKRTLFGGTKAEKADSVLDGLRISLNESGRVNVPRIAELTGKTDADVRKELAESGMVFRNPSTGGLETRDEYLSGAVRRKLREARAAAEVDPSFQRNVEALEKVQPQDKPATSIKFQIGQSYIPNEMYRGFLAEKVFGCAVEDVIVGFDAKRDTWLIDTKSMPNREWVERSPIQLRELLTKIFNGSPLTVKDRVDDGDGKYHYVINAEKTQQAEQLRDELTAELSKWLVSTPERAKAIERAYNDKMNDNVERKWDPELITLDGISDVWKDRANTPGYEHQKRTIARGVLGGNLCIAHCVGAGKSFEMFSICMQLRRLGLARKPVMTVPNHMVESGQIYREFKEAYPGARIIVATKNDLESKNRRRFLAKVANGDWDCVVMAHSSFSLIGMDPKVQAEYIAQEIADLRELMNAEAAAGGKKRNVKRIEKKIRSKEEKMKKLLDASKKDSTVPFENLGVDYILVDEAHNFKGLDITTRMSNVAGVTGAVSQRAQDMEMKARYLAKLHGGDRGIIFASGTIISNSISEMYTVMRFLAPEKMREMGIYRFDDWAKVFGVVETKPMPRASGKGYQEKTRFAKFQNLIEMKKFFHSFADVVLDEDLNIPRPYMIGGKPIVHRIKADPVQVAKVEELDKRLDSFKGKYNPKIDNPLKVVGEGRLVAIDPALLGLPSEHRRLNAAADEIYRIWQKSTGKPVSKDGVTEIDGTQLVFCDSGVPKEKKFKEVVRTPGGGYATRFGNFWAFTVSGVDANGYRHASAVRSDGATFNVKPFIDHGKDGAEDISTVYAAFEEMAQAADEYNKAKKVDAEGLGLKKYQESVLGRKLDSKLPRAEKPQGEPFDINAWIDENAEAVGYDIRLENPFANERNEAPDDFDFDEADETEEREIPEDADEDTEEEDGGDADAKANESILNMLRGKFNVYAYLKKLLIQRGIPADEIAFIHDAANPDQKRALFADFNGMATNYRGGKRVLIGNTPKMGEGANVQKRLVAIHHLDVPWKPAWLVQRDGRGIRAGNLNDEIGIHRYVTEGTFDVYSYDKVSTKQQFINQAMNHDMTKDEVEDVDDAVLSAEEAKAAAAGPMGKFMLERVHLQEDIRKAELTLSNQRADVANANWQVDSLQKHLEADVKAVDDAKKKIADYHAVKGDQPFGIEVTADTKGEYAGKTLTDSDDIAKYFAKKVNEFVWAGKEDGIVGHLFGMPVWFSEVRRNGVRYASINIPSLNYDARSSVDIVNNTAVITKGTVSVLKAAVTKSTGQGVIDELDRTIAYDRKQLEMAIATVKKLKVDETLPTKIDDMYLRLAEVNNILGAKDEMVARNANRIMNERIEGEREEIAAAVAAAQQPPAEQVYDESIVNFDTPGIYTGTAADYANESRQGGVGDGPSLHHVGTGEGSQVYGWGLYGSTVRGVAEHYANRRNLIEDLADAVLEKASGSNEIALDDLRADKRLPREDRFLKMSDEEIDIVEKYIKGEDISKYETGNLYEQTFFTDRAPGDESHLLKWYEPVEQELVNRIIDKAKEEGVIREDEYGRTDEDGKILLWADDGTGHYYQPVTLNGGYININVKTGEDLYKLTCQFFPRTSNRPKAASEFLARAGIDGVKYPVDSYGGKGVKNGDEAGWNYVSFRDDNIRVDHKWTDGVLQFDTPELTPAETEYAASEDKTPTEKVMREVYGMTNEEIATALRAAGMEPPPHARKTDEDMWKQAETLLSNPSYMAKLSRAVAKFPRPIRDYENAALSVLFRERQAAVNDAQIKADAMKATLDEFNAIPKDERDAEITEEIKNAADEYTAAKARLAQAKAMMAETGNAMMSGASEQGRALRSNRVLIDQHDLTYAGISGQIAQIVGGAERVTPEMDAQIREIAKLFEGLDAKSARIATERLAPLAQKVIDQTKNGIKVRKATERKAGDEAKRVMRNYQDALNQIEVGAAEVGGTLIGMSDQQYPGWGKWLKAIGEFHCFENPNITEEECINAIVEDISPFVDADANQVRDALTGFGHNFKQSRYDSQRLMNDLKAQARLKRQMDWMDETNTMPPLTGIVRDEPSDTTRNLQKQVQERKKEVPDAGGDERRLKGVLDSAKTRVRNRIADMERAIETGEKIPASQRKVVEDLELRELKKRKEELQKVYDELFKTERTMTDAQRIALTEKLLARELERAIEDLDRARAGDFSKRPKRPGVESPTIDVLRDRIAQTREQIRELKKAKYEFGMTPDEVAALNARKMANREKAVARLAERIATGDLRPQKKLQPPMTPDQQKQYDELGEQMKRGRQKLAELRLEAENATVPTFRRKIGEFARFATTAQRALRATMDFSAVLRQAARMTLAHPVKAAQAFGKAWTAARSEASLQDVNEEILSDPTVQEAVNKFGLHLREVDATSARDVEMFHGMERNRIKLFGKEFAITDIPFFGEFMLKSERHYLTYLNAMSADLYTSIVNGIPGTTAWQKKMVADMINIWNGSAALSKERRQALQKAWVNDIFWAPQLAISRVQSAAGYDWWHPLFAKGIKNADGTFEKPSDKERVTVARAGLSQHLRSTVAMLAIGWLLRWMFADDDDKYNFSQADWFEEMMMLVSPKIGNTTIDLTGGEISALRTAHKIYKLATAGEVKTGTGRTAKSGSFGGPSIAGTIGRFAQGKLSPSMSTLVALLEGKDFVGDEFTPGKMVQEMLVPLTFEDIKDQFEQNGVGKSLVTVPLTLLGAGGSTYDRKPYENAVNRFLESKKEFDAIDKDDLLDEKDRQQILDGIRNSNPLMRDDVRDDIAAEIAQIRKDEARAKKDAKNGNEPDEYLLSEIEAGKRNLLEKIRSIRRQ